MLSDLNRYEKCQVSNCDNCIINYLQCQTCKSGFTLSVDYQCYQSGINVIGYGLVISGGNADKLAPCTINRCQDCTANNAVCTTCSITAGFRLFKNDAGQCLVESEIPSQKGPNLQTSLVEDCITTSCDNCKTDKTQCSKCLATFRLYQPLN